MKNDYLENPKTEDIDLFIEKAQNVHIERMHDGHMFLSLSTESEQIRLNFLADDDTINVSIERYKL
jgi:hypothetical protein